MAYCRHHQETHPEQFYAAITGVYVDRKWQERDQQHLDVTRDKQGENKYFRSFRAIVYTANYVTFSWDHRLITGIQTRTADIYFPMFILGIGQ